MYSPDPPLNAEFCLSCIDRTDRRVVACVCGDGTHRLQSGSGGVGHCSPRPPHSIYKLSGLHVGLLAAIT